VGNLVCPAEFDLGEHARVVLASTPEGDDKPIKYPIMFHSADCVVLNKIDLEQAAGFSRDAFRGFVSELRADMLILELSCRTGEGLDAWLDWLRRGREAASQGKARRR
jgi:hydrogenase nickel incorporation protein HypB